MTSIIRAIRLGLLNVDFVRQVALRDMRSGFVVGIIALPMSIGIALASGFPPFAGLLSSIIGGLLVSFISGSRLCIKGPAGGLSALTLSSVMVLGDGNMLEGYSLTLAAIMVAGVLQILSAFAKMGNLGDFFPAAVIHGMLAALGFIMVVKQLPPWLGSSVHAHDTIGIIREIPSIIFSANPKIALLGIACLLILVLHKLLPKSFSNFVPSVIFMLLIVIPVGLLMELNVKHAYHFFDQIREIDPQEFLVNFPSDYLHTLKTPNFFKIGTVEFWFFAVTFSLACNIESLLTCKAVDQLDPYFRSTDYNRDLMAIGVGNILCGLFGGLPMISESKRSVVNVNLGGSTFASNFFHALFLLLIILVAQPLIRLIPVCALAAFLIYTGIKMTLPKEFSKNYQIGKEQFFVFVVVFVVTIFSNLLIGVLAGTLLELLINLRFGASFGSLFNANMVINKKSPYHYEVNMNGPAIFSNFLYSKKALEAIPKSANVVFDFSKATVVDHSYMENLSHYEMGKKSAGGSIAITGLEYHSEVSSHPLAARRIVTNEITPRQKELQAFADQKEYDFDNRRITNPEKFNTFQLAGNLNVLYQENVLKYSSEDILYEMSDIHGDLQNVHKQFVDTTVLHIANFSENTPDFILEKEGFTGGLFNIENKKDINFESHPAFSYYYYLTGENEDAVIEFFQPKVFQFFETHKGYNLSMADGSLLVYKRTDLLATDEIEKMLLFAKEFIELVKS